MSSQRAKMPAKDRLIEEATVASMGLKRSHVFGLALGAVLMTACLASAGLVRPTMGFVGESARKGVFVTLDGVR